jgi:hypothetical protein
MVNNQDYIELYRGDFGGIIFKMADFMKFYPMINEILIY